jgi:DNA alkylation damage repair protein AlkB
LFVFPRLLSEKLQIGLLDKIMHRDLSDPRHQTNVHFHHIMPYESHHDDDAGIPYLSFFAMNPGTVLQPKDPSLHKPISVEQMLRRKLRWVTLGGQYDWTRKAYPDETPPPFPEDIALLLKSYFPLVDAQAAIVNFYTPGDTLSIHRDVSEECNRGLISISIGCDGLFLIGNDDASRHAVIRLRSGDAVLMSGESRFAWHAVPKVIPDTCPAAIQDWPHTPVRGQYKHWHAWLKTKRINLNVRQMR